MALRKGKLGFARIAIVTVVPAEMDAVQRILRLRHNLLGSQYYVSATSRKQIFDVVGLKLAERTNMCSNDGTKDLIEDFRP